MLNLKKVIAILVIVGAVLMPIGRVSPFGISLRDCPETSGLSLLAPRSSFSASVDENALFYDAAESILAEEDGELIEEEPLQIPERLFVYEIDRSALIDAGTIIDLAKKNKFNTIFIRGGIVAGEAVASEVKLFCVAARKAGIKVIVHVADEKGILAAMPICDGVILDDLAIKKFDIGGFWKDVIAETKKSKPDFLFIAQLGLWEPDESTREHDLQQAGFKYTYDSKPYELMVVKDNPKWLRDWLKSSWKDVEQLRTLHFIYSSEGEKPEDRLSVDDEKLFAVVGGFLPGAFAITSRQFEKKGLKSFYKWLANVKSGDAFQEGTLYTHDAEDFSVKQVNENIVAYSRAIDTRSGLVVANVSSGLFEGTLNLKGHKQKGHGLFPWDSYVNPLGLDADKHYILKDEVSGEEVRLKGSELMDFKISLRANEWRVYTLEKEAEPVPVDRAFEALKAGLGALKEKIAAFREGLLVADRLVKRGDPEAKAAITKINEEARGIIDFAERCKDAQIFAGAFEETRGMLDEELRDALRIMKADKILIDFGEGGYYSIGFSESEFVKFVKSEKRWYRRQPKGKVISFGVGGAVIYVARDKESIRQLGIFKEEDSRTLSEFWTGREGQVGSICKMAQKKRKGLHEFFGKLDHDVIGTAIGINLNGFFEYQAMDKWPDAVKLATGGDTEGLIAAFLEILENDIKFERFDIAQFVKDAADHHIALARQKGLAFKTNFAGGPLVITGSRNQLSRVFANLISNAVKYTQEGSISVSVSILYSRGRKDAIITIADTGIGVPEEDLDKIFKGQRAGNVGDIPGTGIGLRTCQEIVEMHKGRLAVKSKVGKGTTFKVTLPMEKEDKGVQVGDKFVISDNMPEGVVAVIELGEGDAELYAGNLLSAIRNRKNRVEAFLANDPGLKDKLRGFAPAVVFAPYGDAAVQGLIEEFAAWSKHEVAVYFYESPHAPFGYNVIQPYSRATAQLKEEAIRLHASQVSRIPIEKIAEFFGKANAAKAKALGITPASGAAAVEQAEFYKMMVMRNGEIEPADTSRMLVFGDEKFEGLKNIALEKGEPVIFISPHPDDCEISGGGLVRTLLLSGADVSNWVLTAGWGAFIPEIDLDGKLSYEDKKRLKIRIRQQEARDGAEMLGMMNKLVFFDSPETLIDNFRAIFEKDPSQKIFTIVLPDENDSHPRHRLATKLVLDDLAQLTEELGIEVRLVFYSSPWEGEFNAFYYSENNVIPSGAAAPEGTAVDKFSEAQNRKAGFALVGGELIVGFGKPVKAPQELGGRYAERFLIRRIAAGSS